MIKADQIPMEVQDALNKAHGFIISPQALATALNAWPFGAVCHYTIKNTEGWELILPLPKENTNVES